MNYKQYLFLKIYFKSFGDVFLANYMTAHFIAPNDSPDIRYALYFRVTGTALNGKSVNGHCPDSMLKPWLHWPVMNDIEI